MEKSSIQDPTVNWLQIFIMKFKSLPFYKDDSSWDLQSQNAELLLLFGLLRLKGPFKRLQTWSSRIYFCWFIKQRAWFLTRFKNFCLGLINLKMFLILSLSIPSRYSKWSRCCIFLLFSLSEIVQAVHSNSLQAFVDYYHFLGLSYFGTSSTLLASLTPLN